MSYLDVVPSDASPATQNVTIQDTGSSTTTGANNQSIITGTPTASSAASFAFNSFDTIKAQVSGTWTGTLQSELSLDGGTTWYITGIHQTGTPFTVSTFTANFSGGTNVSGVTNFRIRATAAMTGTAVVKIIQSINPNSIYLANNPSIQDPTTPSQKLAITAAGEAKVLPSPTSLSATSYNGQKTVATAGTAVQVTGTSSPLTVGVIIQALATNTGNVYIGNSSVTSSNGFQLQPGQATSMALSNLNLIYVNSVVNGDGVCYLGS